MQDNFDDLQDKLVGIDAVKISSYLVSVDKTANKIFNKWSNFIITKKNTRKTWLKIFNIYLLLAIWLISPIVYILHIFLYPLKFKKIKQETQYYKGV